MTAETLRRATALMRERAEAATPGPWRDCPMGSEGSIVQAGGNTILTARKPATCREFADATHIASWHPAVALAVAELLDAAIEEWEEYQWPLDRPVVQAAVDLAEDYLNQSFRPERGAE